MVCQSWSVSVDIPLNRGHICSVLSKGILSGLNTKENDAKDAFGRLSSSCGVTLRKQDRKNRGIPGGCSIAATDWLTLL